MIKIGRVLGGEFEFHACFKELRANSACCFSREL